MNAEVLSRNKYKVWNEFFKQLRLQSIVTIIDFQDKDKWLWKIDNTRKNAQIKERDTKYWFEQTNIEQVYQEVPDKRKYNNSFTE